MRPTGIGLSTILGGIALPRSLATLASLHDPSIQQVCKPRTALGGGTEADELRRDARLCCRKSGSESQLSPDRAFFPAFLARHAACSFPDREVIHGTHGELVASTLGQSD